MHREEVVELQKSSASRDDVAKFKWGERGCAAVQPTAMVRLHDRECKGMISIYSKKNYLIQYVTVNLVDSDYDLQICKCKEHADDNG